MNLMMMKHTRETDASAEMARMSAQETTPGQADSRAVLILSTTLKPLVELTLGAAPFSETMLLLLSNNNDPSQPYITKNQ